MKSILLITTPQLRLGLGILLMIILTSCSVTKPTASNVIEPEHNFAFDFIESEDLSAILKQAKAQNKLVFVDVYTTWCLPCKMMDRDVFTHKETADAINSKFISYRVDAEQDNGLIVSFNYDVTKFPTLLFLDAEGEVLERKEGAAYHEELLALAQSALTQREMGD